jgi:hypothetical protein
MWPVRFWIPWFFLAVLTALVAASAVVGATANRGEPAHRDLLSPFYTPAATLETIPTSTTTLPPQARYRGVETFCASAPLSGDVLYNGTAGQLVPSVLTVAIGGLPPNNEVYVDWSNDHIRGYIIGSFSTNTEGTPIPASISMGRFAEVPGVEMVLESTTVPPSVLGRLQPC